MDIRELSYFVEVAEQQSFTKAAKKLNISQPALSKCIVKLEEEWSVKLFTRGVGGISITEDGLAVLKIARELLTHFDNAQELLTDLGQKSKHSLTMGFSPLLQTLLMERGFAAVISSLTESSCIEGTTKFLISQVADSLLDFSVGIFYENSWYDIPGRVSIDAFHEGQLVMAARAGVVQELSPFASPDPCSGIVASYDLFPLPQKYTHAFASKVYTDNLAYIVQNVEENGYVALVPDIVAPVLPDSIRTLPLDAPESYRLAFVNRQFVKPSKAMREAKRFIMQCFHD